RLESHFAEDISAANAQILGAKNSIEIADALRQWLQKYQPCLFGRVAAKMDLLSFCILTKDDLVKEDAFIKTKIQEARTNWTREAFHGKKSGFIVLAASFDLVNAEPNLALREFAARLCSLYLLDDVGIDTIYSDEV